MLITAGAVGANSADRRSSVLCTFSRAGLLKEAAVGLQKFSGSAQALGQCASAPLLLLAAIASRCVGRSFSLVSRFFLSVNIFAGAPCLAACRGVIRTSTCGHIKQPASKTLFARDNLHCYQQT